MEGGAGGPLPPIIFERWNWPQQTIYHWKGNLSESPIYFFNFAKIWAKTDFAKFLKVFRKSWNIRPCHTTAHGSWYAKKLCVFENAIRHSYAGAIRWSVTGPLDISQNYIFEISRSRSSKLYIICSYFKSLNFFLTAILEPLRSHFARIAHKVAKSKMFPIYKMPGVTPLSDPRGGSSSFGVRFGYYQKR